MRFLDPKSKTLSLLVRTSDMEGHARVFDVRGYLRVARVPFLALPVTLTFVGAAASVYAGEFDALHTSLSLVGLVLLTASVNSINDYSDWRSGIDNETEPTKFSGGSGAVTEGELAPKGALVFGLATLFVSFVIGLYFLYVYGAVMVPLILAGGLLVVGYTDMFARLGFGEVSAGLGLGALPVVGVGLVQSGSLSDAVLAVSVVPFFSTFNLLLLNEFPDLKADIGGGRKNLIILLGERRAKLLYVAFCALAGVAVVAFSTTGVFPVTCLVAVVGFVPLYRPVGACLRNDEITEDALAGNVAWVLGTNVLLAAGFMLSSVF